MPPADEALDGRHDEPLDQLRHDLLTPVTVISARVGMMERTVRRSASMTDAERGRLLVDAAAIQAAVLAVCAAVDGMGGSPPGAEARDRP